MDAEKEMENERTRLAEVQEHQGFLLSLERARVDGKDVGMAPKPLHGNDLALDVVKEIRIAANADDLEGVVGTRLGVASAVNRGVTALADNGLDTQPEPVKLWK